MLLITMRKNDVFELLAHVKQDMEGMIEEYQSSLENKNIQPKLKIDIKNLMENLRSILDYTAHDIYDSSLRNYRTSSGKRQINRIYFPYGKDDTDFRSMLGNNLPELDTINPTIFDIVESLQPHKANSPWLLDLCNLVNQNKHDSITPQTRVETKRFEAGLRGFNRGPVISAPAGSIKAPPGSIRIGNVPVDIDPTTGIPIPTRNLDVKVTTWVSFNFSGTQISVLPFLSKSISEIEKYITDLYKTI